MHNALTDKEIGTSPYVCPVLSPYICPEHSCGDKDLSILTLAAVLMIFCVKFYEYMFVFAENGQHRYVDRVKPLNRNKIKVLI